MIPLYKLEKLPRTQKLRKLEKIFSFAEKRLCAAGFAANCTTDNCEADSCEADSAKKISEKGIEIFTSAEFVFFIDAAKLLLCDELLPQKQNIQEARKVFTEASDVFTACLSALSETEPLNHAKANFFKRALRRTLNNIKHILLTETGSDQADWDFTSCGGQLDAGKRQIFKGMQVYLEDIRSPFNVGAMFRTAESFGVEKIILSPFCADPRHRRAERTAMGCINVVPWERRDLFAAPDNMDISHNNSGETQQFIPPEPLPVFALETGGIPISEFAFPKSGLLIAGSEELGVSPLALEAADASLGRVSIPCYGTKASLNVSVAFGIALQAWSALL